jgi:hypothetical protein
MTSELTWLATVSTVSILVGYEAALALELERKAKVPAPVFGEFDLVGAAQVAGPRTRPGRSSAGRARREC